jgi:NTP pyrophosphatase (non-canonical NTP hydrolase)
MTQLQEVAKIIMQKCRDNNAGGTEQAQIMALAEEAGEFVGAMRRWRGMARRSGTEEEAQAELADVVITAYGMANVMGWDLESLISNKVEKVMTRGWKENVEQQ